MANLPISGLTASAANLASTDLLPVVQTVGVGPVKMTGLQLAGGLLGSTALTGATVTTSKPVLNLSQTWNDGAGGTVTFTGLRFNATDTASAAGSLLLDLQVGGASKFSVNKAGSALLPDGSSSAPSLTFVNAPTRGIYLSSLSGNNCITHYIPDNRAHIFYTNAVFSLAINGGGATLQLPSNASFGWGNGLVPSNGCDLLLYRDNPGILALKNSTNPQIFRAYSTTTGPSYGYLAAGVTDAGVATADTLFVGTGGVGAAMTKLAFVVNGTTRLDFNSTASGVWSFPTGSSSAAGITFGTVNTGLYSRSANFVNVTCGGIIAFDFSATGCGVNNSGIAWAASNSATGATAFQISYGGSAGQILFSNAGTTPILQLGGTTASFPALKRSSATLAVRLADDSADAAITCLYAKTGSTTVASLPSASTAGAGARMFVTDANATTFLSTVAGGGSNKVPVVSDGTNWLIG